MKKADIGVALYLLAAVIFFYSANQFQFTRRYAGTEHFNRIDCSF